MGARKAILLTRCFSALVLSLIYYYYRLVLVSRLIIIKVVFDAMRANTGLESVRKNVQLVQLIRLRVMLLNIKCTPNDSQWIAALTC